MIRRPVLRARLRRRAAAALALLFLAAALAPAQARAQATGDGADVSCLWRELPTVVKARIELAARLGRRVPVTVLNRFAGGGLSAHLRGCGFEESLQTLELTGQYWLAAASEAVQIERLRLAALDQVAIAFELHRRAPEPERATFGAEIAARAPGAARELMVDLLETLDRTRRAATGLPYSDQEKRVIIEYAATWLIREGLEAAATPFEGPPPGVAAGADSGDPFESAPGAGDPAAGAPDGAGQTP